MTHNFNKDNNMTCVVSVICCRFENSVAKENSYEIETNLEKWFFIGKIYSNVSLWWDRSHNSLDPNPRCLNFTVLKGNMGVMNRFVSLRTF